MGHAIALALGTAFALLVAQNPTAQHPTPVGGPAPDGKPATAARAAESGALTPPPPRAPIAGLRGYESRSRIEYPAQPGRLHDLRAAYVFPDRVRWWISARDGSNVVRRMRYRSGPHVFSVEAQQSASIEFRAEDRAALIAAFDLRRALFLWPDEGAWTGEGDTRTALLANGDRMRARVAGTPPRPTEIEYLPASDEFRDRLSAITWRADGARTWPATFEVWNGATLAWRETVDGVDVETRFVDSFFVPPDRRGVAGVPMDDVRDLDIPAACVRRIELDAGTTWDAARAELTRARTQHAEDKGAPLEELSTFEVRKDGAPAAIVLRLARMPDSPPKGFAVLAERVGTATSVSGLRAVDGAVLGRLAARLPGGGAAGRPYVRFDGAKPDIGDVVVVVPVD